MNWTPTSWHSKKIRQVPDYTDKQFLQKAEDRLASYPPLVFAGEARDLKNKLAQVCRGESFLLQGGDCAESFAEHSGDNIRDFFRVFMQMAAILTFGTCSPIVKIGRIAGQFAKPRSSDTEIIDGIELPSYRGDIINSIEFDKEAREPNAEAMIKVYRQSAATLNLIRAFAKGGYADLRLTHNWTLDYLNNSKVIDKYHEIANAINDILDFMQACGVYSDNTKALKETDFYTSHEALLLNYEQALVRIDSTTNEWYATSAHFLWIGDRTRDPDEAHVEFCRGIKNPLGVKCGPSLSVDSLLTLCDILNPDNEEGRLTLICRFGSDEVNKHLPNLIEGIKKEGRNVVWCCDPMHGNTIKASNGYKTRDLKTIFAEVQKFIDIHNQHDTHPGGVHFEMTGKDVTECIGGGISCVSEENLSDRYHTHCDPRLNASQALELAFMITDKIKQRSKKNNITT